MRKSTWFLGMILTVGLLLGPCLLAQEQVVPEDDQSTVFPEQESIVVDEDVGDDIYTPDPVEQDRPLTELSEFVSEKPLAPAPPVVPVEPVAVSPPRELYELPLADPLANAASAPPADNLISISLEAVPVPDVVNMFSRISGANIIVAGTFTNLFVTANLRNVEWKSALSLALGSVNLSMIEDPSGIIMVVNSTMYQEKLKQIEETKPLVTRNFPVRYMNAVDLAEQIKLLKILSPRGTIITSQSKQQHGSSLKSSSLTTDIQNPSIVTELIVCDIKEYVDRVGVLIERLDRREKQVFIEARIVDVITGDSQKLGFDWEMLDRFGVTAGLRDLTWEFSDARMRESSSTRGDLLYDRRNNLDEYNRYYDGTGQQYEVLRSDGTLEPTRTVSDSIDRGRDVTSEAQDVAGNLRSETKMGSAILTMSDASLFLSALRKNSNAQMISHPLLIVGNRVEAKIHVGERYPTVFSEKTVDSASGVSRDTYSEQVEWNDLGLTLWVIPEIDHEDNVVRLTVNPQMSSWVKDITTPQGSVYPVITTRHLSSRVNVPSGHTVVIGGLMENSTVKREKRVPILGDIPLLGLLFRHTEDTEERSNLLIMLTPTILDETEPITGMEIMAQQVIDELEYLPLSAKKPLPSGAEVPRESDAPAATEEVSENDAAEDGVPEAEDVADIAEDEKAP